MGATPGYNKIRKAFLEKQKLIRCGHCPYHRKENATRHPRSDKHKNHRRLSANKFTI